MDTTERNTTERDTTKREMSVEETQKKRMWRDIPIKYMVVFRNWVVFTSHSEKEVREYLDELRKEEFPLDGDLGRMQAEVQIHVKLF